MGVRGKTLVDIDLGDCVVYAGTGVYAETESSEVYVPSLMEYIQVPDDYIEWDFEFEDEED